MESSARDRDLRVCCASCRRCNARDRRVWNDNQGGLHRVRVRRNFGVCHANRVGSRWQTRHASDQRSGHRRVTRDAHVRDGCSDGARRKIARVRAREDLDDRFGIRRSEALAGERGQIKRPSRLALCTTQFVVRAYRNSFRKKRFVVL